MKVIENLYCRFLIWNHERKQCKNPIEIGKLWCENCMMKMAKNSEYGISLSYAAADAFNNDGLNVELAKDFNIPNTRGICKYIKGNKWKNKN